MPLIKVWNHDRSIRKLVKVDQLRDLLKEGGRKLGYEGIELKACLEIDGTEIDDEDIFNAFFKEQEEPAIVMILPLDFLWIPSYQQVEPGLLALPLDPTNTSPGFTSTTSCGNSSDDSSEHMASTSFSVPWNKLPKKFMDACTENKRPDKRQRNAAINIIASEILSHQERPTRKFIEKVAENVVKAYPASLKSIIGKEHEYFFTQLENRIYNECRIKNKVSLLKTKLTESQENQPIKDYYGCVEWQPELPENETVESLQEVQNFLNEQFAISSEDEPQITLSLNKTYCLQRMKINSKCSIREFKKEWPYLQKSKYLMHHANRLLGINLKETWMQALNEKLTLFYSSIRANSHKNSKLHDHLLQLQEAVLAHHSRKPEEASFCETVLYSLNEDPATIFQYFEQTSSVADIQQKLGGAPVIAILGSNMFSDPEGYIFVDKEQIGDKEKISSLIVVFFSIFYVFNLQYPEGASLTMEFLQRVFYKINPTDRRSLKVKKRSRNTVHPKVLNFVNFLQSQGSIWNV